MGPEPRNNPIPRHVAVIMDGNGRWAKKRGLPRKAGHRAGAESVRKAVDFCLTHRIEYITFYAFSSENWSRPQTEVESLMKLLESFLKSKGKEFTEKNVRLKTIGEITRLPDSCQAELQKVIKKTEDNTALTVVLALSYGGREELTRASRRIAERIQNGELQPEEVTTELIGNHLDTADIPDPDLLIRTSGELRLSNFLLWQLSYSEFFISEKFWPDFHKNDFQEALDEYARRNRRFGRL